MLSWLFSHFSSENILYIIKTSLKTTEVLLDAVRHVHT